jgi:hypothetical protein
MWQDARSPAASESQCSPSRQVAARGAHPGRAWQLAVTGTLAFKNGTGVWVTVPNCQCPLPSARPVASGGQTGHSAMTAGGATKLGGCTTGAQSPNALVYIYIGDIIRLMHPSESRRASEPPCQRTLKARLSVHSQGPAHARCIAWSTPSFPRTGPGGGVTIYARGRL